MQNRQNVHLEFTLRPEHIEKLRSATYVCARALLPNTHSFSPRSANYQLRIYCTTSTFYTAPTAFRPSPSNSPCPVEFPNTCELRVNNVNLHAATKGMKKKPGTAPPANAGSSVRATAGIANRLEMIYCNNNPVQGQPPNNKVCPMSEIENVELTVPNQRNTISKLTWSKSPRLKSSWKGCAKGNTDRRRSSEVNVSAYDEKCPYHCLRLQQSSITRPTMTISLLGLRRSP